MQPVRPGEDLDVLALRFAEQRRQADEPTARRLRGDFVASMLPFAVRLAHRYRGRAELADLEQVAGLGLIKAVDRYDAERGSFTAYAVVTIVGELKRHFRDHTWGVHVSRRTQELVSEINFARTDLGNRLGRPPTDAELAERCQVGIAEIEDARQSSDAYRPSSLNRTVGDSGHEVGDFLGSADPAIDQVPDLVTIARLMPRLPPRVSRILALRFYDERTQSDIAAELGISQMHVSRLLTRALDWMREALLTDTVPRWPGSEPDPLDSRLSVQESPPSAGTMTVRVTGEVDRDNAARLRELLTNTVARMPAGGIVHCDLAGVPFLDAAGVGALLKVAEVARVRQVRVRIDGLQPLVRRVAEISGLTELF